MATKFEDLEHARLQHQRKSRKRIIIIGISSLVLVAVIVGVAIGTHNSGDKSRNNAAGSLAANVKAVCDVTLYKDSCVNTLKPMVNSSNVTPQEMLRLLIQAALDQASKASEKFSSKGGFKGMNATDQFDAAALQSCQQLLDLALDHLNNSLNSSQSSINEGFDDLRTWISTAGTCYQTCIDGFKTNSREVQGQLQDSTELSSNGLAIVTWLERLATMMQKRKLMSASEPEWLRPEDRELLGNPNLKATAKIVVAQDGSGKYKTISGALKAVPANSKKRTVIYVKKGVYREKVLVDKTKWNVVMVGDGIGLTIVTGSLNFVDGTPTFQTATFAVYGQGFMAQDMTFQNTAGPIKQQAVALMSNADLSIFYRCSFEAYQDTLYTHANRQFYRDCKIYGTVDFIFGNSAVVFQNCQILPRKPRLGQQNTITAQGRFDPHQPTGISIQNCTIVPAMNLTGVQTFLGRPWKNFSTTVYMQNYMGSLINPKGWLPWIGTTAPSTIYYAEFANFGPGAVTTNRVTWKGLRFISSKDASKFTAESFIQGQYWIPHTGVPFRLGL